MGASHSASCLAALASLEACDSTTSLTTFLSGRRTLIVEYLEEKGGGSSLLTQLTVVIQNVLYQIGELFLGSRRSGPTSSTPQSCMLEQAVSLDDVGYSGQLFGDLDTEQDGEGLVEERMWNTDLERFGKNLSLLNPETAARECSMWLAEIAEEVTKHCDALLGTCKSLHELSNIEGAVNEIIMQWKPTKDQRETEDSDNGTTITKSWSEIVESSMGLKTDIWADIFEKPFRQRALQLVEGAFQEVLQQVSLDLEACLELIHQSTAEPLGAGGLMQLLCVGDMAEKWIRPTSSLHSPSKSTQGHLDINLKEGIGNKAQMISKTLDDRLMSTLEGVIALLDWSKFSSHRDALEGQLGTRSSLSALASRTSTSKSPRKQHLEPRIQELCEAAANALCNTLCSQVEGLEGQGSSVSSIESALLLGTLCMEISERCSTFPVFLGSPDNWRNHLTTLDGSPARTARAPSSAFLTPRSARSRVEFIPDDSWALKDKFRRVGLKGFHIWATWAARGLARKLKGTLEGDGLLRLKEAPQSWEKIAISSVDDVGVDVNEMYFQLPSCPSGAMMKALLESCRELQRVGGHSACKEALQLFEWELGSSACDTMKELLDDGGPLSQGLQETGALQLLLDIRLLRDVLAGAQPLSVLTASGVKKSDLERRPSLRAASKGGGPGSTAETVALMTERKRLFSSVESTLSNVLDPIDWATYEPHLWKIEERFYQRSSVLFGALIRLSPIATGGAPKMPQSAETNLMNLVPSVSRFQYLPIRAPALERRSAGSVAPQAILDTISSTSLPSDPTGNYSFSDLGSRRALGNSEETTAHESSTTFAGLQAKLGSMFGDKAAEVSALAQQQFGDLTSGVSTGWLSTLSFKGMGRTTGQAEN